MSQAELVSTDPSVFVVLPRHTFADSYMIRVGRPVSAREAAEGALAHPPAWIRRLVWLRDLLVMPFGLKATAVRGGSAERIGAFPIVSESAERVVLGFDDKHLDFRIVVDSRASKGSSWVIASTLVRTHNLFGRVYLFLILPFHRAVVKAMLQAI